MTRATFLERNKKKSLLAALLLFLRQRKVLVLLLFLVLAASTVFVSPSSWITGLPGGARFAAGVAWIAGKLGVDVSRWGLGPGNKHSYDDLLLAFRNAKAGGSGNGGAGVGWGPFFGHGVGSGAGAAAGPGSLDFVKGSKSDLEHGVGAGGEGAGAQTVAGIVDPADPNKGGNAVAIDPADLTGQRENVAKESLADGFMKGLLGGAAGSGAGDGSLSGGAFAGKEFFSGVGGAAGTPHGLANDGLAGLPPLSTPASVKGAAAQGKLSKMASRALALGNAKGVLGAGLSTNLVFQQLAQGNARAQLGTQYCKDPDCPGEFAATNSGAMYDGNTITSGFLTSSDPGANSAGLGSAVNVPSGNTGGVGGGGVEGDAQNMKTCTDQISACAVSKQGSETKAKADEDQLESWLGQMGGACGNPCNCGPCNDLKGKIKTLCDGDLAAQMTAMDSQDGPCGPLPDFCAALGFTSAEPASVSDGSASKDECQQNMGQCGCTSFFCSVGCLLGS